MITFTNPRLKAEFDNWPMGGTKRGVCKFHVEQHPKRGFRVGRQTTGKVKYHTYGHKAAIVDGSDGRTYILQMTEYGFIDIVASDFMSAESLIGEKSSVFHDDARFQELLGLIKQAHETKPEETAVELVK